MLEKLLENEKVMALEERQLQRCPGIGWQGLERVHRERLWLRSAHAHSHRGEWREEYRHGWG